MPEVLTKHPEKVVDILEKGGEAECGEGVAQQILTECPQERFCQVEWVEGGREWAGEICAYGLDEVQDMTQISEADMAAAATDATAIAWGTQHFLVIMLALILGIGAGYLIKSKFSPEDKE